jgi:hypothetical protein
MTPNQLGLRRSSRPAAAKQELTMMVVEETPVLPRQHRPPQRDSAEQEQVGWKIEFLQYNLFCKFIVKFLVPT